MSFDIALSGINAIKDELDTITNNIANSGTYGFKSSRTNFTSVYAGSQANGVAAGSITQSINTGGNIQSTGRPLDVAIAGRGFFIMRDPGSSTVQYSRVGIFNVDKDGYLTDTGSQRVQGYAVVPGSTALGAMGDLKVPVGQIAAKATGTVQYVANLSADWTTPATAPFNAADPTSFNSSMVSTVFDSLGAQHTVTQYFVKSGASQVTVNYSVDGAPNAATTTLTFGTNGQLTAPAAPVALNLGTPTGAAPLTVNFNYAGTTLFAGQTTTSVNSSDGYASGTLTGVSLAEDGTLLAQYSNGQKQGVGMLALAAFPNEGALTQVSGTAWEASAASGTALLSSPGTGLTGKLATGALEQSNVNVTSELVGLMTAQRNYQANSKVISAENQMVQSLMQAM
ncbi:flagellar hook protein FlgE [Vogesella sp. LIG4]|uniref:flagellar hook protein FlgE n=1 Tax=Vogesella sp. LIG4 TaxID=1192162 RepID=UPI00081FD93B|nr:flagellar hook-basal body complex protein [Vogesella sp. LIG4]SCK17611.1 flagellar hook protein FlgE [Vogesella sp. LIG4]